MEIAGLPLHPLVVHAAVVLTPLAVLAVIAFAVWPRHRWATRWPAAGLTAVAFVATWAARLSGDELAESKPGLEQAVHEHAERGEMFSVIVTVLLVVTALAVWSLGGPSALASGKGAVESRVPALDKILPAALVLVSIAVLVSAVLVGDSGARAVWGS
jgi:uncharacterized membrane protein